jgi:Family of unknown function (DUF5947)
VPESRLQRLARATREPDAPGTEAEERCELCGRVIAPDHRHLLDLETRELKCTCRPCSLLFDRRGSGGGHLKFVGDRRLALTDFAMDDVQWEELRVPVDMAFFFRDTKAERVSAFYPSPMGPTESLLTFDAWRDLEEANPILAELEPDVEALLVNRARGERSYWLVPIEDCYALVGTIRTSWRGLTGGKEVWEQIGSFFDELGRRARPTRQEVSHG